jgi:Fe-S-cluster containining protein
MAMRDLRATLPQMPGETENPSASFGTARFALKVQDVTIEMSAQLPYGPTVPMVLLPVLQNLSDSLTDLTIRRAAQLNEQLSCREGCGACCRQAVPISPTEARMLSQWIDQQPEPRRSALRERFQDAAARLEESGVAGRIRAGVDASDRGAMHAIGLDYFALGVACPFLDDERCTIHPIRPLRCREYLVVSPAEHCAHPQTKEIVGIRPPVVLSQILARWSASGDAQGHELILLTMLDEWVAAHPESGDDAHRTAPEMLQEFLHAFAGDAKAAPADPRVVEAGGDAG